MLFKMSRINISIGEQIISSSWLTFWPTCSLAFFEVLKNNQEFFAILRISLPLKEMKKPVQHSRTTTIFIYGKTEEQIG